MSGYRDGPSPDEREMVRLVGERYNHPPPTPREEMWQAIAEETGIGLPDREQPVADADVVDLSVRRRRRSAIRWLSAAAVLIIGFALGRGTAPDGALSTPVAASTEAGMPRGVALAAQEHFTRSEALLTMVRADASGGTLDPMVAGWAADLLDETRLLLDASGEASDPVTELLLDLELVLVQIVGAGGSESAGELDLAIRGMDQGAVLTRVGAAAAGV